MKMDICPGPKISGFIGCLFVFIFIYPAGMLAQDYSVEAGVKVPLGGEKQTQEKVRKKSPALAAAKIQMSGTDQSKTVDSTYTVSKVISGDVLELNGGVTVRLIGVDCPKMQPPAAASGEGTPAADQKAAALEVAQIKQAADFTRKIVADRKIRLEYGDERMDKDNQVLAYVFVESELSKGVKVKRKFDDFNFYVEGPNAKEIFLNATLVAAGYAQEAIEPPDAKYKKLFGLLQQNARTNKRGFWG